MEPCPQNFVIQNWSMNSMQTIRYFWDEYCSIQKPVRYLHPFWLHRTLSYKISVHLQRFCSWLLVYESEIITQKKFFIPTTRKLFTELNQNFKIYIYVWVDYLIWLYSLFPVNDFNMVHGTCIMKVHNKVLSHVIIINRNVIKFLAPD